MKTPKNPTTPTPNEAEVPAVQPEVVANAQTTAAPEAETKPIEEEVKPSTKIAAKVKRERVTKAMREHKVTRERQTLKKILQPYLDEKKPGQGFAAKVGSVTLAYFRKAS
jgi:hypothetical protein